MSYRQRVAELSNASLMRLAKVLSELAIKPLVWAIESIVQVLAGNAQCVDTATRCDELEMLQRIWLVVLRR